MTPLDKVAILRNSSPGRAAALARDCWLAGMDLVEVPVQGEFGWQALDAVSRDRGRAGIRRRSSSPTGRCD